MKEAMEKLPKGIWPSKAPYLNGEIIYLATDEEMAEEGEKRGLIVFTLDEVTAMDFLKSTMSEEDWIARFRNICGTKFLYHTRYKIWKS